MLNLINIFAVMLMPYFWLLLSSFFGVVASIALKLAAVANSPYGPSLFATERIPYYIAAISAYGAGFFFYAVALRNLDLSIAYPLMVAISIIGVVIYGVFFGGEAIGAARYIGVIFIAVGIVLLNR
ncbi:DMT family transporter [Jeongeupia chitinilytica]|uniref:Small multidrug resistance protein n=1 Tax=Jeongeupia chitinilytica TaxID=1041641 RepID=A0ABQ3H6R2_9NEIS|nr:SMR family transporter [Jeongeupia chitinilytica]GHD67418.1 hypothetical protein GCM10007350_31070 [Jeongeupia chitinilytica]